MIDWKLIYEPMQIARICIQKLYLLASMPQKR